MRSDPVASPEDTLERLADAAELTRPSAAKRMLVIVNPYATTMSDRLKHLVVYALQGRYDVEAVDTSHQGHAIELCREAADEGYDVVVAFGGDGTVNEAANGLAGSPTPLTCLPGGATNVYCRMLGIPNDVVDATEHLLRIADDWRPRTVDLPEVNGRAFTFSAGVGLDASVVEHVDSHPVLKRRYGAAYFTASAVAIFSRRYLVKPPRLRVQVDGAPLAEGVSAMVQNGDPYTYYQRTPIRLAEGNELDSGTLAGVVLERASPMDMPTVSARAFLDGLSIEDHRQVTPYHGAHEVVVASVDGRELPLQVDGDFVGRHAEARFALRPGELRVVA